MKCPYCGSMESMVRRTEKYDEHIRRERVCRICNQLYVTAESCVGVLVAIKGASVSFTGLINNSTP